MFLNTNVLNVVSSCPIIQRFRTVGPVSALEVFQMRRSFGSDIFRRERGVLYHEQSFGHLLRGYLYNKLMLESFRFREVLCWINIMNVPV